MKKIIMGITKYFEFNYNEIIYHHFCDISLVRGVFIAINTLERTQAEKQWGKHPFHEGRKRAAN